MILCEAEEAPPGSNRVAIEILQLRWHSRGRNRRSPAAQIPRPNTGPPALLRTDPVLDSLLPVRVVKCGKLALAVKEASRCRHRM